MRAKLDGSYGYSACARPNKFIGLQVVRKALERTNNVPSSLVQESGSATVFDREAQEVKHLLAVGGAAHRELGQREQVLDGLDGDGLRVRSARAQASSRHVQRCLIRAASCGSSR